MTPESLLSHYDTGSLWSAAALAVRALRVARLSPLEISFG